MIRILDLYIIKKFLMTFLMMFLLFIPIGILVDISEKIDKFKEHELSFTDIIEYYSDFVWYYGYFLFSWQYRAIKQPHPVLLVLPSS